MSLLMLSFKPLNPNDNVIKRKHLNSKLNKTLVKSTCNCDVPTGLSGSVNGGVATLRWNTVSGAVSYSVGGYYSCFPTPPTFNVCATANSVSFPVPCGGTFRVTANCDGGGVCLNATCSGSPSNPATF